MKCALQTPSPVDRRKHCAVSSASTEHYSGQIVLFKGPHLWVGNALLALPRYPFQRFANCLELCFCPSPLVVPILSFTIESVFEGEHLA
ncbi:hypothetical protein CDAR_44071 [Caerostris darwini]|uniref:Uncharacterized protein n=1 Tax=Caerostris darwini TaxID=1538125 RepID=A0AAV4RUM5_9ARAC|nr:hypothetical protein CDAR_44071 [Caerostris darwini]